MPSTPRTLFDKIWRRHVVHERDDGRSRCSTSTVICCRTAPLRRSRCCASADSRHACRSARSPRRTTMFRPIAADLSTCAMPRQRAWHRRCVTTRRSAGIRMFGLEDARQGIVHVVGPEQGLSQPGMLIVCGDSHTSTHGAVGALAFGIGASEVAHVLATQTIWQRRPKTLRITIDGALGDVRDSEGRRPRAHREDRRRGRRPGTRSSTCRLDGARTFDGGSLHAVQHVDRSRSALRHDRTGRCDARLSRGPSAGTERRRLGPMHCAEWRALRTDDGAVFDREVTLDASRVEPMVTWGNSPEDALPITGRVPDPKQAPDAERREAMQRMLAYMDLAPGTPLADVTIDRVFIGSCTNSRIEDLRSAAGGRGRAARRARRGGVGRTGLRHGQGAGRRPKGSTVCSPVPASNGASPGARCALPRTAIAWRPASAARPRRTATSWAGRDRDHART